MSVEYTEDEIISLLKILEEEFPVESEMGIIALSGGITKEAVTKLFASLRIFRDTSQSTIDFEDSIRYRHPRITATLLYDKNLEDLPKCLNSGSKLMRVLSRWRLSL